MTSVFSRIIAGELPGRIVHTDEVCVAMLTIAPMAPGHTLVVPRAEVDHWVDLEPAVAAHLTVVAQRVALAQREVFAPARVALLIAGFEVAHTHLHVIPAHSMADLDLAQADTAPDPAALDAAAELLRSALAGLPAFRTLDVR